MLGSGTRIAAMLADGGVRPPEPASDVHARRLQTDRERKRRFRAEARKAGEPLGHAVDSLLIDGLAIALEGRSRTDPVTVAVLRGIGQAIALARVDETADLQRRLRSRLRVGSRLRTRRDEAAIMALETAALLAEFD